MRILLVDDHILFLEGLRNLLASECIEIAGLAHDGFQALAQARRLKPDTILMDVRMPRCDGLTAVRLIKAEMPNCKIVMLTMSEDDQDLFEAVKSGASGYLLKQLNAADFFTYLEELRIGHPPFSPGLAEKILREYASQAQRSDNVAVPGPLSADQVGEQPETGLPVEEAKTKALSPRQMQILTLVAQGQAYREVAETIGLSERTIKYHMAEILKLLHLENRAQVIAYAAQIGLTRRL
jgi:DNA-binding NarL/FixJ family response regulator